MQQIFNGLKMQASTSTIRELENRDRFAEQRVRHGKTHRDHSSGAHKRRLDNQQARASWQAGSKTTEGNFPSHAARGNGNSSKRRKYYG